MYKRRNGYKSNCLPAALPVTPAVFFKDGAYAHLSSTPQAGLRSNFFLRQI